MARMRSDKHLTAEEKQRLMSLLGAVSSHTLLKVLRDMDGGNADACLIIEVLLERLTDNGALPAF